MLQVVASLTTVILTLMLQESSIMLPKNIYSTGVTHDDHHMMIKILFIVHATGHNVVKLFRSVIYECL